jgi:RNA polymerase sigma-70 factor, ECF subfamily
MKVQKIYQEHFDKIYAFFYYKTYDTKSSEDLTSQTFLIYLEKVYDKDVQITDDKKFLYGIMRKVWLRFLQDKYKKNEQFIEDMDNFASYVDNETEKEGRKNDRERVSAFIDMLPRKQKEIMSLRLLERCSLAEIAHILGKDMNYVKTTQKRGIKSLKSLIKDTPLRSIEGEAI